MIVIGIDPGLSGGIALIEHTKESTKYESWYMPTLYLSKTKKQINCVAFSCVLDKYNPDMVIIEQVHAMPKQGVSSTFNFGMGYGMLQGVVLGMEYPMELITPQEWKKHFKLWAKGKDASRAKAQLLFPMEDLGKKKDDGRAEALLIAKYYLDNC